MVVRNARTAAADLHEHVQRILGSLDLFPQLYAVQMQELDRIGKGKDLWKFLGLMQRAMARCQRIASAIDELSGKNEDVSMNLQNLVRVRGLEWHMRGLRAAGQHEVLFRLQKNQLEKLRGDYEDVLDQYGEECEQNGQLTAKVEDLQTEIEGLKTKLTEAETKAVKGDGLPEEKPQSMDDIHKMMSDIERKTVEATTKGKGKKGVPPGPPPGAAAEAAPAQEETPAAPTPAAGKAPPPKFFFVRICIQVMVLWTLSPSYRLGARMPTINKSTPHSSDRWQIHDMMHPHLQSCE